jgi:hypothetical protein
MRAQSASADKESARTARTSYPTHKGNSGESIIDPDERPRPIDSVVTEHAQAIRSLGKRVLADVIEIGRRLTECKGLVGHGNWGTWLDREFGWTDQTARNFMQVHGVAGKSKKFLDLRLPLSSLYLLAAPSTPPEVRDEIIEQAERGETPTRAEIVERVGQSRALGGKSCKSPSPAPNAQPDRRAAYIIGNGERATEPKPGVAPATADIEAPVDPNTPSHRRHRGSGESTSSAVAIAKRLLVDLIAHGLKAEPKQVACALRKELPQSETDKLMHWLDRLLTEMRAGRSDSEILATLWK